MFGLKPVSADGEQPRTPDEELQEVHGDESELETHGWISSMFVPWAEPGNAPMATKPAEVR